MRFPLAILLAPLVLAVATAQPAAAASDGLERGTVPAAGCIAIEAGAPGFAIAYDEDPDDVPLDNRVIASPPLVEVEQPLQGGEQFVCTITIRNRREERTTLLLEPRGVLGSRSPHASAQFVDPDDPVATGTAGSWLKPLAATVTLDPRGVAKVPVRVTIPDEPPSGAAFGAIDITTRSDAPGPGETNLGITSGVSVLFFLRIGTEGRPDLQLRDVHAPTLRWSRDSWTLRADLDNDGAVHATPRGRVRIRSLFGNTVHELPIAGAPLLPGGRQPVEVTWDDVPWFGIYRFDVRVAPAGDEHADRVDRADGWFVVLPPWWVLLLALLVLAWIVAGLVVRRRRIEVWDDDPGEDELSVDPPD